MGLAESAGLGRLADEHVRLPTVKGANAGLKVTSLVAGMAAGADSIDDMALLRHGGMGRVFAHAYAPSTLGSFLRTFTFGHVRQLDAVASRFLLALAGLTRLLGIGGEAGPGSGEYALLDVDDTIIEVHGHGKQGAGFGHTRVRGLNALLATLTTTASAPMIVAQRLRKGACNSSRGAKRLVGDAVKTARRLLGEHRPILVRMDSAYFGRGPVHAALIGGAAVSVTVRMNAQIKAAIAAIAEDAWTTIEYTDAVFDEATGRWISRAEGRRDRVHRVRLRQEVRARSRPSGGASDPGLQRREERAAGQGTLFDVWRFHADLKNAALAHLPSGVFAANAAWLVLAVMAFNLTRAAGTLGSPELARATTSTIRRKLINVPARVATSARRGTLHLPQAWPWQTAWTQMFDRVSDPPCALAA